MDETSSTMNESYVATLTISELEQYQSLYKQTKDYYEHVLSTVSDETKQKDPTSIQAIELALQLNSDELRIITEELAKRTVSTSTA